MGFKSCIVRNPSTHHSFDMVNNISITTKLGTVNSQFYRFLRLCLKVFFISQKVSLIVLLENKGYPLKIFLKRSRASPIKRTLFLEFEDLESSE
jgi:hypothetical protein